MPLRTNIVEEPRRKFLALKSSQQSVTHFSLPLPHCFLRALPNFRAFSRRGFLSFVVGKIMDKDQYSYGYDAQTGEYGNLVTKGIIDPTKVVRCALQGAVSVAGLLITTEAMVAEVPKKETAPAMPGGGMGGMDY